MSNSGKTNGASMSAQYVVVLHSAHASLREADTKNKRSDSDRLTEMDFSFERALAAICPFTLESVESYSFWLDEGGKHIGMVSRTENTVFIS